MNLDRATAGNGIAGSIHLFYRRSLTLHRVAPKPRRPKAIVGTRELTTGDPLIGTQRGVSAGPYALSSRGRGG